MKQELVVVVQVGVELFLVVVVVLEFVVGDRAQDVDATTTALFSSVLVTGPTHIRV